MGGGVVRGHGEAVHCRTSMLGGDGTGLETVME